MNDYKDIATQFPMMRKVYLTLRIVTEATEEDATTIEAGGDMAEEVAQQLFREWLADNDTPIPAVEIGELLI